jgi:hypothetical protein
MATSRYLSLSLNQTGIVIPDYTFTNYARDVAQYAAIGYTATGVPTTKGLNYESKQIWQVTALLDEQDMLTCRAIAHRSNELRIAGSDPSITIVDTCQQVLETAPRTRALAPASAEIIWPTGEVAYYAVFKGWISDLKTPVQGRYYSVSITVAETEKVAA